jgi:hypothetical protein
VVIDEEGRWAYLAPPKTGSTSLTRMLAAPPFRGVYSGHQHDMDVPAGSRDFLTFASVRNPYARAVSLWMHRRWAVAVEQGVAYPLLAKDCPDFGQFLDWHADGAGGDVFYAYTISDWLRHARVDAVVPLEDVDAAVARLGLTAGPFAVPVLNSTKHRPWPEFYDNGRAARVAAWAEEDFERFGYDPTDLTDRSRR